MNTAVPLGSVLTKSGNWIEIDPLDHYTELTVHLWGRGVSARRIVEGSEIAGQRRLKVLSGEFVVSRIDARHGAFAVVPDDLDGAVVSNDFPAFRPSPERLLPKYLGWLSRTHDFVEACRAASEGTTNRVRLKEVKFAQIEIPLPPLAEQRRIVTKIERLAAKIDQAQGLRSLTTEEGTVLRRSSYRSAEVWAEECGKRVRLADVITSHDAGWSPDCDDVPAGNGEWGILKTTSVQWDGFDARANKVLRTGLAPRPRITVKDGDVLVTRAGPMGRVGVACTVRNPPSMLMLSDKIIRIVADERILPEYLSTCIAMPSSQEVLRQGKTGLAASQVNISRPKLLNLQIFMPSPAVQRRIVAYLDGLQAKVDRLKALQAQTRAELDALLPSILDRAFKGEL